MDAGQRPIACRPAMPGARPAPGRYGVDGGRQLGKQRNHPADTLTSAGARDRSGHPASPAFDGAPGQARVVRPVGPADTSLVRSERVQSRLATGHTPSCRPALRTAVLTRTRTPPEADPAISVDAETADDLA